MHARSLFFVTLAILPDPGGPGHKSGQLRKRPFPSRCSRSFLEAWIPNPVKVPKGSYRNRLLGFQGPSCPDRLPIYPRGCALSTWGYARAGEQRKGRQEESLLQDKLGGKEVLGEVREAAAAGEPHPTPLSCRSQGGSPGAPGDRLSLSAVLGAHDLGSQLSLVI